MKVLIACEFSGIVRDAFIARGHQAVSCDLLPTERPGPHIQGSAFDVKVVNGGWDLMIARMKLKAASNESGRRRRGPERKKNRSRTYQGIAEAMAEQWGMGCAVSGAGVGTRPAKEQRSVTARRDGHYGAGGLLN